MTTINKTITSFENLNNNLGFLKISDMLVDVGYIIQDAYRTSTRYGDCIVLRIDEKLLYLPKRYNTLDDEDINILSKCELVKSSHDGNKFKLHLNEIKHTNMHFFNY